VTVAVPVATVAFTPIPVPAAAPAVTIAVPIAVSGDLAVAAESDHTTGRQRVPVRRPRQVGALSAPRTRG
jgi:hypothetical protein